MKADVHVVHAPGTAPSAVSRHWNVAPVSAVNDHDGVRVAVTGAGALVIVGAAGGWVSRMYVVLCGEPVLPAGSVAQTNSVYVASPAADRSALTGLVHAPRGTRIVAPRTTWHSVVAPGS